MHGRADRNGLILASLAGPHYQRHFYRIIRYGRDVVRVPDLLVQIDQRHVFAHLRYVEIQTESDLGEGHDYGSEELQAEYYVQHLHRVADHQMPFLQRLELHQQKRIPLLVINPPEEMRLVVHHELPQTRQIFIELLETGL